VSELEELRAWKQCAVELLARWRTAPRNVCQSKLAWDTDEFVGPDCPAYDAVISASPEARDSTPPPAPMLLWCPGCGQRHLDEGEFATKPHHTHACQHCGHVWRPAVVATVGVRFLPGFKNEQATAELRDDTLLGAASLGEIAAELRLRALSPRAQRDIDRIADELLQKVPSDGGAA